MLRVRCPGPLGSCSPVCTLRVLCCVCSVLGNLAPIHQCARSMCCAVCAVSWATCLLFTGVHVRRVVLPVRCFGRLASCSPMCMLSVLCCVCAVVGHLNSVQRCAPCAYCAACAVSWATRPVLTGVLARCAVLCVRCSGPLWLLFTLVQARGVVLCVRCPGPLGSCSPVCTLGVLCCVCGVLGHLAPVRQCTRSVSCVACVVSWATWLLFTGVHTWCVVLHMRCPGQLGTSSQVCPLGVLCCV